MAQGCHNLITFQGPKLLEKHVRRWPFMDYNTPGGRVARHAWVIRDQWWPILAEVGPLRGRQCGSFWHRGKHGAYSPFVWYSTACCALPLMRACFSLSFCTLRQDMVAVSVWHFFQRHSSSVFVPMPAWAHNP